MRHKTYYEEVFKFVTGKMQHCVMINDDDSLTLEYFPDIIESQLEILQIVYDTIKEFGRCKLDTNSKDVNTIRLKVVSD